MAPDSEAFAWEVTEDRGLGSLAPPLREALSSRLRASEAPLRWALFPTSLLIYALPLLFLQDSLIEALAGNDVERAWLAVAVLALASTLVLSPLFGLLVQAKRERNALFEAGRRYPVTEIERIPGRLVRLSLDARTSCELLVSGPASDAIPAHNCFAFAFPEEANVAAVTWQGRSGDELVVGRLETPLRSTAGPLRPEKI